jgi:hypothetical protein
VISLKACLLQPTQGSINVVAVPLSGLLDRVPGKKGPSRSAMLVSIYIGRHLGSWTGQKRTAPVHHVEIELLWSSSAGLS